MLIFATFEDEYIRVFVLTVTMTIIIRALHSVIPRNVTHDSPPIRDHYVISLQGGVQNIVMSMSV